MSIQDVRNSWIYLDRNTQIWRGHISATQGVYQPIHWVTQGRMQAELRLTPYEGRIADVGCGHGILTVNLAWKLPRTEVIGIDPDEEGLAVGRELLREHQIRNCSFRVGTIEQPGIAHRSGCRTRSALPGRLRLPVTACRGPQLPPLVAAVLRG